MTRQAHSCPRLYYLHCESDHEPKVSRYEQPPEPKGTPPTMMTRHTRVHCSIRR